MKNFWLNFVMFLIFIVAVFFLVSLIMSNIHDVTMLVEWNNWLKAIGVIKETSESVAKSIAYINFVA